MRWYEVISVLIVTLIVIYIGYEVISKIIRKKNMKKLLEENKKEYQYTWVEVSKKGYDYVLKTSENNIYIKVATIPSNSQVCINAKETWALSYGGSKINRGRVYPQKRYMTELENFLKSDIKNDLKAIKVILLYKSTESIVRYLNESELETVTIDKTPYGYKVMQFVHFKEELGKIIKK